MSEFYSSIQGLTFNNVDDLFSRKVEIREKYAKLDYPTKQIYKWFFYYQLCLLRNPLKRLLWDFINGAEDLSTLWDLSKEYRNFCNKRKKIYPEEFTNKIVVDKANFDDSQFDNYM